MKPRIPIDIGKEYGWLTVLGEGERDKSGHYRYHVRCRCGNEYDVQPSFLKSKEPKCKNCVQRTKHPHQSDDIVGETINSWEVLQNTNTKDAQGNYLFECRCIRCGEVSYKRKSEVLRSNGKGCKHCFPDYYFTIYGNVAQGILPDGTEFLIDAEDVEQISKMYWNYSKSKGYIQSAERKLERMPLHRFLLNITDSSILVDHINRNRMDCRKSNLRIATAQQNSMNCSMRANKTGYKGVSFIKRKNLYRAQIGINDRDIHLGSSKDSVKCAQMYNIAAQILFREYCGHINDVPDADSELQKKIENKLLPYLAESEVATQSCSHFLCDKGA